MPAEINYKTKYLELRSKYINDLDMAFRLGHEEGAKAAQQQQASDVQAQNQAQLDAQNGMHGSAPEEGGNSHHLGGSPGKPSENPSQEGQPMNGTSGNGSEIDQHIDKLQGMIGKGSGSPEMKKSLDAIVELRKAEKLALEMNKSAQAISGIAKALHKPQLKLGINASHNMNSSAKNALSMQHKIVSDVMDSWKSEEDKAAKDIRNVLNVEGLLKV